MTDDDQLIEMLRGHLYAKHSLSARILPTGVTDSASAAMQRDTLRGVVGEVFAAADLIRFYGIADNLRDRGGVLPEHFDEIYVHHRQAHNVSAAHINEIIDFIIDGGRIWSTGSDQKIIYTDYDCLLCFFNDAKKLPKAWWINSVMPMAFVNPHKGLVSRAKSELKTYMSKNKSGCVVWIDFTYFRSTLNLFLGDEALDYFWQEIGLKRFEEKS